MGDLFTPGLPRRPLISLDGYMLEESVMIFCPTSNGL